MRESASQRTAPHGLAPLLHKEALHKKEKIQYLRHVGNVLCECINQVIQNKLQTYMVSNSSSDNKKGFENSLLKQCVSKGIFTFKINSFKPSQ
jgi:hypothetical protein